MSTPATTDDYIAALPEPAHSRVSEIRDVCRAAAPHASEAIKWGHPAYLHSDGVILFMATATSGTPTSCSPRAPRAAFADELAGYKTGKGSVTVPYDSSPPTALLRRMIAFRIHEYEDDGITWM